MAFVSVEALLVPGEKKLKRKCSHTIIILQGIESAEIGGAEGDRTPDLMTASHALSQLSYGPLRSE